MGEAEKIEKVLEDSISLALGIIGTIVLIQISKLNVECITPKHIPYYNDQLLSIEHCQNHTATPFIRLWSPSRSIISAVEVRLGSHQVEKIKNQRILKKNDKNPFLQ